MDETPEEELKRLEAVEGTLQREQRIDNEVEYRKNEVARAHENVKDAKVVADLMAKEAASLKEEACRVDTAHKDTLRDMEGVIKTKNEEIQRLQAECGFVDETARAMEIKYKSLCAERDTLNEQTIELNKKLERQDVHHTSALQKLQECLDKANKGLKEANVRCDKADIENQKDTLLLKLFKEQVEHKDTELELTRTQLEEARDVRSRAEKTVSDMELNVLKLETSAQSDLLKFSSIEKELKDRLAECAGLLDAEKNVTDMSATEIDSMKERTFTLMLEQKKKEAEWHKTETQLRTDVKTLERKLTALEEDKLRDDMEANLKIESLMEEKGKFEGLYDALRQKHHEAGVEATQKYGTLKQEHEELLLEYTKVNGQVKASQTDMTQKITLLMGDVERLKEELRIATHSYEELQCLSEKKETELSIKLNEAQTQICRLNAEAAEKEKMNKDAELLTWHEKEEFKQQASEKAKELEKLAADFEQHKITSGSEIRLLRKREHDSLIQHRAMCSDYDSSNKKLISELTSITKRFDGAVTTKEEAVESLLQCKEVTQLEITGLKNEIHGYKEAVGKLETEVLGNYDKKVLAAQNEELKSTLQTYRNQITSLNHTISSIKIEANIIESHKTKALQASNTQCVNRILSQQEQLDSYESLLYALLPLVEPCPQYLKEAVEAFKNKDAEVKPIIDNLEVVPVNGML